MNGGKFVSTGCVRRVSFPLSLTNRYVRSCWSQARQVEQDRGTWGERNRRSRVLQVADSRKRLNHVSDSPSLRWTVEGFSAIVYVAARASVVYLHDVILSSHFSIIFSRRSPVQSDVKLHRSLSLWPETGRSVGLTVVLLGYDQMVQEFGTLGPAVTVPIVSGATRRPTSAGGR